MYMEKDEFIQIYNKLLKEDNVSIENAFAIITKYCLINDKDKTMINLLLSSVGREPIIFQSMLRDSMEGLIKHFEITTITDLKTNKIIFIY